MILIVIACLIIGLVYGRLPSAVAERVFAEEKRPLLTLADLARPFPEVEESRTRLVIVHATSAGLFAATAAVVGTEWVLPAYLWFVAVTLVLTLTDIDRKLIPNRILFPSFAIAAGLLVVGALLDGEASSLVRAGLSAVAFFAALFVIAIAARGGFGMGDVKLGALLGLFLGYVSWEALVVGGVGAFVVGGVVSLLLLVFRIKGRKDAIPFGPYLVVAAWIAVAASAQIGDWYRG